MKKKKLILPINKVPESFFNSEDSVLLGMTIDHEFPVNIPYLKNLEQFDPREHDIGKFIFDYDFLMIMFKKGVDILDIEKNFFFHAISDDDVSEVKNLKPGSFYQVFHYSVLFTGKVVRVLDVIDHKILVFLEMQLPNCKVYIGTRDGAGCIIDKMDRIIYQTTFQLKR